MADVIKIYMKEMDAESWTDITTSCAGVSLTVRKGFTSLGSAHDVAKCSFEYKADSLAAAVLFHNTARQVKVEKNGNVVFNGYAEDSASVDSTALTTHAWVNINAYPYSKKFEEAESDEDIVFEGLKICDPSDADNSLLHQMVDAIYDNLPDPYKSIMAEAGTRTVTTIENKKVLDFAYIEAGDSILDAFTQCLHEWGYVYYMDGLTMYIVEPYDDAEDRNITRYEYSDFVAGPTIKTSPYIVEERTEVTLGKVTMYENEQVFQLTEDGSSTESSAIEVDAYYPEDGDLSCSYESDYDDDYTEVYYTMGRNWSYDARISGGTVVNFEVVTEELNATEALFRFRNNAAAAGYLNQLTITAERLYVRNTATVVEDESLPNAREVNEVETYYLTDTEDCENYIKTYRAETLAEKTTFTLSSGKITAPEPNSLIMIGDLQNVLLVRYTETDLLTGDVTISAVSFDVKAIDTTSKVNHPSANAGYSFLSLALTGSAYTFDSDGNLSPTTQETITATLTRYGVVGAPTWYINGEEQASHELTIDVPASFMTTDRWYISVRAVVGTLSTTMYIYKLVTGASGKDAPAVQIQYAWGTSATVAPTVSNLWIWEDNLFFWKGNIVGTMEAVWTSAWTTKPTDGKTYYLWVRFSTDGGETWTEPACISGENGQDGADGEDGTDGDALSLAITSETNTFTVAWTGLADPTDQSIVIKATAQYIAASGLIWTTSAGELETVEGDDWSRRLRVSSIDGTTIKNATPIKIEVSGISILQNTLSEIIWISFTKAAMPSPIYCGSFTDNFTVRENPEREEGAWADGDYVLYLGEAQEVELADGSFLTLEYGGIYEYVFSTGLWQEAVTAEHMFGALEDALSAYEENPDLELAGLTIIKNLMASNIATQNIVADMAKVTGTLQVTQIQGESPDGSVSYELNYDHFYAGTNNGEDDDTFWELTPNGSATFKNATIIGNLTAAQITHNALTTKDNIDFPGGDHLEKTFEETLWSIPSMWSELTGLGYIEPWFRMQEVSESLYGEESVSRVGFATSGMYPSTTLSDRTTEGSITFGRYEFTYSLSSDASVTPFAKKTNNYSYPVFVYVYLKNGSSFANNTHRFRLYDATGALASTISDSTSKATREWYFYLPAGYSFEITSSSDSWYKSYSHTLRVYFAPSPGMPYRTLNWIGEVSATSGRTSSYTDVSHGSVYVPEDAEYWSPWWYVNWNNSNNLTIVLSYGGTTSAFTRSKNAISYTTVPSAFKGKTVSVYVRASRGSRTNDEGQTSYYSITYRALLLYIAFYDRASVSNNSLLLQYGSNNTPVTFDASYTDYRAWEKTRFKYEDEYDSIEELEKISGDDVYAWFEEQSFEGTVQMLAGTDSTAVVDSTTHTPSEIIKYSEFYALKPTSGTTLYLGKVGNGTDGKQGIFESVVLNLYPVAEQEHVQTGALLPRLDNRYSIGSEDVKYQHLFLGGNATIDMALNLGAEGTDYYFGTSSGYITLANGFVFQWGRVTAGSGDTTNLAITFPKTFSTVLGAVISSENTFSGDTAYWGSEAIAQGALSTTGMTVGYASGNTSHIRWLAWGIV